VTRGQHPPQASGRRGRIDFAGAATITGAISFAVYAIVDANQRGASLV
jgi:hypothetical protein